MAEHKIQRKISKPAREKQYITYKETTTWVKTNFSAETMETKWQWNIFSFKCWKTVTPNSMPSEISFKDEDKIETDKENKKICHQ